MSWTVLAFLLSAGSAAAGPDFAGAWVMTLEGRAATVLKITPDRNSNRWRVERARPGEVTFLMGQGLAQVGSGAPDRRTSHFALEGDRLVLDRTSAGEGRHSLRLVTADVLAYRFEDAGPGLEPILFRRVSEAPVLVSEWDPARRYNVDGRWPSNPAMTALFRADQAARASDRPKVDRARLLREDAERLAATRELLDAGELLSGEDLFHAAFIFQHGGRPDRYLTAHALAVASAARGHRPAVWIAAAALDRYLQATGRPQVYGTQFTRGRDGAPSQEPFDRAALPDVVRGLAGVPPAAQQIQVGEPRP